MSASAAPVASGPRGVNIGELVDFQVGAGLGDKPAYIAVDATLTYGQLRRQINRAANVLRALGVTREQRVLLVLDDTTAFPILFLAAMKIAAVPVPVSVLDRDENFAHYVQDTYTPVDRMRRGGGGSAGGRRSVSAS